jgi:tetratricopeptide (TPR) repeat protein
VLRAQGDWNGAGARYELALERFPDAQAAIDAVAKYHMDRGLFLLLFKKQADAIASFRKALSFEKTTTDLTLARQRLHEIAVAAFGEGMEKDKAGRPEEAAESFALSVSAEPTAEGHFARGVVLAKAGRHDDALAAYDAALAVNDKMLAARLNRAGTLARLGRLDEAASDYRAWTAAAPADDPDRSAVEKQLLRIDDERRAAGKPR